uniref:Uncharacterized protein n=1 Tax=Rhizophora mucronata TaxID=61149 RepID=A0A2P2MV36_RHIMU
MAIIILQSQNDKKTNDTINDHKWHNNIIKYTRKTSKSCLLKKQITQSRILIYA